MSVNVSRVSVALRCLWTVQLMHVLLFLLGIDGDGQSHPAVHGSFELGTAALAQAALVRVSLTRPDDDHTEPPNNRELHRERGYAPTIQRPRSGAAAPPCASTELPPTLQHKLNTLCAVMVANGARIDGIELGYNQLATPDGNVSVLGFRATRELKQGETILFVPYSLTLSSPVVRRGVDSHLVRTLVDPALLTSYEEEEQRVASQPRAEREQGPAPEWFLSPLGLELLSRVAARDQYDVDIDDETMWLAASVLEAEATHPPPLRAVMGRGGMGSGGTGSEGAAHQMPRAEWLAHMAHAEYADLPDHLPRLWYTFPTVYRRTLAVWRRSRNTESGDCSCNSTDCPCNHTIPRRQLGQPNHTDTTNAGDVGKTTGKTTGKIPPLYHNEDHEFDSSSERLRRMHAVFVAAYSGHADARVRRHVCDPRNVVRVVLQLESRIFGITGDHYGRIAAPLVDMINHRPRTHDKGLANAWYKEMRHGVRVFTSPYIDHSAIAKGEDVRISYGSIDRGNGDFVHTWGFVDLERASCEDREPVTSCAGWAAKGECEGNPKFMHERCTRSCALCDTAEIQARLGRVPAARLAARRLAAAQRVARRETKQWRRRPDAYAGWMVRLLG